MSDGVHPLMQAMKPPSPKANVDGASRNAEVQELPARHNAMLALRELRQQTIDISAPGSIPAFTTHIVVNAGIVLCNGGEIGHDADGCRPLRADGALKVTKAQRK